MLDFLYEGAHEVRFYGIDSLVNAAIICLRRVSDKGSGG
jgi:hypothetical protein